jgi:isopenicillin-N epimerase
VMAPFAEPPCPASQDGLEERCLVLRSEFMLRSDRVFLNHGSFGACPRPVFEIYQHWQRELELQPVEFLGRRFTELMRCARQSLATYVGADPDDLVFVPNATTGLNIVARSLPLQPGDEVLATEHEYGATDRMWRFMWGKRDAGTSKRAFRCPSGRLRR